MSNYDTTLKMLASWKTLNVDAILDFFTDDAIYINIPMEPANRGKDEIRTFLNWFVGAVRELEFIVHHQVEGANGIVMNERTDHIDFHGKLLELPVMGVFEFRDGKICAWRDYFDLGALEKLGITAALE
ncbi:MAG: nuclear transport factor 2 family protein [Porticoccaceae bacterium]|nr:nuclear transport factor 2 family protein [Porticoccaceae bacterium]